MAQRERRERERNEKRRTALQLGQQLRREREKSRDCSQPQQPIHSPSLTPSRRGRACLEQGTETTYAIESTKKRTTVSHPSMPSTSTDSQRNW